MSYDPKAIDSDDRSFSYKMLWLGLPFSVVLLASLQFGSIPVLTSATGGFVSGLFIAMPLVWLQDEFVREEIAFASRWALSVAGIALLAQIAPMTHDFEPDAEILGATMALVFHAALYVHRIRGGALAGEPE